MNIRINKQKLLEIDALTVKLFLFLPMKIRDILSCVQITICYAV
jgi:hypothetical protein